MSDGAYGSQVQAQVGGAGGSDAGHKQAPPSACTALERVGLSAADSASIENQRMARRTSPHLDVARAEAVTVDRSPIRTAGSGGAIEKAASDPVPEATPSIRADALPVRPATRLQRLRTNRGAILRVLGDPPTPMDWRFS